MRLLLHMAWRNIWRNPRRAVILLCAMMAGLVGVLFTMGFARGYLNQMADHAILAYEGHLKILGKGYQENPIIENSMPPVEGLASTLDGDDRLAGWSERVVISGLLSTPAYSRVVTLLGIDPERERDISLTAGSMEEGEFLAAGDERRILISRWMSEKIHLGVGKKVVLMSQQLGGEMGSSAFRIGGIFDTGNAGFDHHHVLILKEKAQSMLDLGHRVTEITLRVKDPGGLDAMAEELRTGLASAPVEVFTWKQRMPLVTDSIEISNRFMFVYYAIFYIAMAFGIVNTLLMAIGERTHEIGVMMAIGMTRLRLVGLFMLESMFIALVATALGTVAGWVVVGWFGRSGIDVSAFSEAYEAFPMGRILYPSLSASGMAWAALATVVVALLFSLYPAAKAARLAPVEAIGRIG